MSSMKMRRLAMLVLVAWPTFAFSPAADGPSVIERIDAGAEKRYASVLGYTVTERYAVFRGADENHPTAEMVVRTSYRKGDGKTYTVVSQSGSELVRRFGLRPLLENEKAINKPENVRHSWFTSANYEMQVKPGAFRQIDGRECMAIAMKPRRKAPNMIDGTLWVDVKDGSLVEMDGIASRNPSIFAGTTRMMRHYVNMNGFAMATRSRAETNSPFFGRIVVTIDYRDYQMQLRPGG